MHWTSAIEFSPIPSLFTSYMAFPRSEIASVHWGMKFPVRFPQEKDGQSATCGDHLGNAKKNQLSFYSPPKALCRLRKTYLTQFCTAWKWHRQEYRRGKRKGENKLPHNVSSPTFLVNRGCMQALLHSSNRGLRCRTLGIIGLHGVQWPKNYISHLVTLTG